jgi:hypothetical protein
MLVTAQANRAAYPCDRELRGDGPSWKQGNNMTNSQMTAKANELSNREIGELELTIGELDHVSGGSLNDLGAAAAMMAQAQAQAQAQGVVGIRIHGR